MTGGIAQGRLVPDELLGPLRDSTSVSGNGSELRRRLSEDGYLFLRRTVNRADISAARGEVFERLAEVGEIRQPAIEGIATGESRRRERAADLGAFWQSVKHGPALRHVSHGRQIGTLMQSAPAQRGKSREFRKALFLHSRGTGIII